MPTETGLFDGRVFASPSVRTNLAYFRRIGTLFSTRETIRLGHAVIHLEANRNGEREAKRHEKECRAKKGADDPVDQVRYN